MFTVYALYSHTHNKVYIGFTSDLELRLYAHNNSPSTKSYTAKYRPWVIVYSEAYPTKKEAMSREKQLKSAAGRRFIRQIITEKSKTV